MTGADDTSSMDDILLCDRTEALVLLKRALQGSDGCRVGQRLEHLHAMKLLRRSESPQKVAQLSVNVPPLRWFHKAGASCPTTLQGCAIQVLQQVQLCVGNANDVSNFQSCNPLPVIRQMLDLCSQSMGLRTSTPQHLYVWLDMDGDGRRLGCVDVELVIAGTFVPTLHVSIFKSIEHVTIALSQSRALLLEAGLDYLCALPNKDPTVALNDARDTLADQLRADADHIIPIWDSEAEADES